MSTTPEPSPVSVPPRWLAAAARAPTQTSPSATARAWGKLPTLIVRVTASVAGSIRATVPAYWSATQTAPSPIAIAPAPSPTSIVACTALVAGSIRETVPSRLFVTHTDPNPTAIAVGPLPTLIVAVTWSRLRVDPQHPVAGLVAHPHGAGADGDVGRAGAAERDRCRVTARR